jgi:hypothetical protein
MNLLARSALSFLALLLALPLAAQASDRDAFTMAQVLRYPFASDLTAAEHGDVIAWVRNVEGVRNVWIARGPAFEPRQLTQYVADDGQEITQLTFSPDGARLVYVRGGDHDANCLPRGTSPPTRVPGPNSRW